MEAAVAWLQAHEEDHTGISADMNQYWYSANTITTLIDVIRQYCLRTKHSCALDCAFVSTPSLFFSLGADERAGVLSLHCVLFHFLHLTRWDK